MKRKLVLITCEIILVMIFYCFQGLAIEKNGEIKRIHVLKTAEVVSNSPRKISLNQNHMIILEQDSNEKEKISVVLISTNYRCKKYEIKNEQALELFTSPMCYELRSTTDTSVFTWTMWTSHVLGHFRLFPDIRGSNYLVWVDAMDVYYDEISKPRDKVVALTDYLLLKHPTSTRVPVSELLSSKPFSGMSSQYNDILVSSLDVEEDGKVTIKFTGTDKEKVYTLIREDGKWRDATE